MQIPRRMNQRIRLKVLMAFYDVSGRQVSELMEVKYQKVRDWCSSKGIYQPEIEWVDDLESTLKVECEVLVDG